MTVSQLAKQSGFTPVYIADDREIGGIYCCDLLSMVMGKASPDDAWFTIMANVNTIAVAVLTDVAVVIVCEGITLDDDALQKAKEQGVNILYSALPIFESAVKTPLK